MPEQRFRSKIDAWLMVLCFAPLLILSAALFLGVPLGRSAGGAPVVLLAVETFMLFTVLNTYYVVSAQAIRIQFGPIRYSRPVAAITRMRATRSFLSSPAWSLDRIELATERGVWILVSPHDKAGFVRAVVAHAPHVFLDRELKELVLRHPG